MTIDNDHSMILDDACLNCDSPFIKVVYLSKDYAEYECAECGYEWNSQDENSFFTTTY